MANCGSEVESGARAVTLNFGRDSGFLRSGAK